MALKFKWTPQAVKGLSSVINYLEKEWTKKEILQLELKIEQVLAQIKANPYQFPVSQNKTLFKAIIDKNNYIVYRMDKDFKTIEIINFRGTKQKPKY